MNTAGVSGGPITQALIRGRSLRVRWSRNKAGLQKNEPNLFSVFEAGFNRQSSKFRGLTKYQNETVRIGRL
jgi:hypothetical protein